MKFDKETVIKHHFWFLLAPAALLAIVGIFLLITVVKAEIDKTRKELESKLGQAKISDAKNDDWLAAIGKQNEEAEKLKKEVWGAAYDSQKHLFTWPAKFEETFDFTNGLFASEIKIDKGATAVDFDAEQKKVVRRFVGTVGDTNKRWMIVSEGKHKLKFRPTKNLKIVGEGKNAPTVLPDLPEGSRVAVTYVQGKYFNDPLTQDEQEVFVNSEEGYRTQIAPIIQKVQPVATNGKGIVQLRDWLFGEERDGSLKLPPDKAPFFRYVWKKEWNFESGDISDEIWIAQEDLWIQRDLYDLIRKANDMVGVLKEVPGGSEQSKTFVNPYWKLELSLTGQNQIKARIWNLLTRRQKLDIEFLVTVRNGADPELLRIPGEPLDPGRDATTTLTFAEPPTGIYGVQQVINWETAAVKRIDHISIGSLAPGDCCQSNRWFPQGLKPFKAGAAKEPAQAGGNNPPGAPGAPPGGDGKAMPAMGGMNMPGGHNMPGGMQGPGGKAAEDKKTPNGLSTERYMEIPSPQVRRVPFGIAMIVDQEHLDRILYVFSKSPLAILTTQVIINRYPGSVRPNIQSGQDAPGVKRIGGAMPSFGGVFPPSGGGFGGFNPFGRNTAPVSASSGPESNMELVVYGIVSLYQRYPPRPKTP